MLRSQLERLENSLKISSLASLNQAALGPAMQYPIPSQWYMPFLLSHCKSCVAYYVYSEIFGLTFTPIMNFASPVSLRSTLVTLTRSQNINRCRHHSQTHACSMVSFLRHRPIWRCFAGNVTILLLTIIDDMRHNFFWTIFRHRKAFPTRPLQRPCTCGTMRSEYRTSSRL